MDILPTYLTRLIQHFQILDRGILLAQQMRGLHLDDIYVPLTVRIEAGITDIPDNIKDLELHRQLLKAQEGQEGGMEWLGRDRYPTQAESGLSTDLLWKRGQHWVLLGTPGAGKTTLLQHLTLTHAQALHSGVNVRLPIYVSLERFGRVWQANPAWTINNALSQYLEQMGPIFAFQTPEDNHQLFAALHQTLSERRALLLFDGLDTIHDAALRARSGEAINALLQHYPGNRCLLTARPISYQPGLLGASFRMASLEPFNSRQIHQFFQQWLRAMEKQKASTSPQVAQDAGAYMQIIRQASAFVTELEQRPGICEYLRSPLLCTLMGMIQQQIGSLPEHQVDLYRLYIETFIHHWLLYQTEQNGTHILLTQAEIQGALEEIALYLQQHHAENHGPARLLEQVAHHYLMEQHQLSDADAQAKAVQLLALVRLDMGLVVHFGEEEYGFFHLAFQEYLAACAMTRDPQRIAYYLKHYLFNPHWQGIVRLAAAHQGMLDESLGSAFIATIQRYPHPREADMHYAFRIAFQCLRDTCVSFQTADLMFQTGVHLYLTSPVLQPALNRLLRNSDNLRYNPQAITPLFAAIDHSEPAIRAKTVELLGNLRDARAVPVLLERLESDSHALVRGHAAEALGQFQEPRTVPILLRSLRDDKSFFVRHCATKSLAMIRDPQVLPSLLQSLRDEDPVIRSRIAEALGHLGNEQAVTELLKVLSKDTQATVRWRAAEALGNLKDPAAMAPLLQTLQQESNPVVRGRAAEALGYFRSDTVLAGLLNALQTDSFPAVRWRAAESLGYLQDSSAVPALLNALRKDSDNAVRWSAAKALGQIKEPSAVSDLLEAVRADLDSWVRWSAAEALGQLHDETAVPVLLQVLQYDKYPSVRGKACQALGYLHEPIALPALFAAAQNAQSASVRGYAAEALGHLQDPSALIPLMEVLGNDTEATVRWYAADALGNLKNPAAVPALLAALREDSDLNVAWRAAQALELIDLGCLLL